MPLQIMQNLYPASWLHLTGHYYVRSMFVKHHFVFLVVCLFVVAVVVFLLLLLLLFIIVIIYLFYYYYYYYFNWYKLDCKFFAELCKFFLFQIKC